METRSSLPLLLAIGISACTCAPPPQAGRQEGRTAPEAPGEAPRLPGLRGHVTLPAQGADGTPPLVEVKVVPEPAMMEFVAARLQEANAALGRLEDARERAALEAAAALAENDRTDQEWKRTMASDLRRRVEIAVRRSSDPAEVKAENASLLARKKASYRRAVAAGKRSLEKEQAVAGLEREARRYREARTFTQGLPSALRTTRTDGSGNFSMDVPPGRYALVAMADDTAGDPSAAPAWLLWIEVREGSPEPLVLDAHNQHGTDCDACVVAVKELP